MAHRNEEHLHQVALFRYGLIADLLHIRPGSGELYEQIRKKAERTHDIPGTTRTRVAAETIRTWLKRYRKHGFDGLVPRLRSDRGQSRAIPQDVADILLTIKEENRALSVPLVIREARTIDAVPNDLPLPPSTVHRLLDAHGLMRKESEQPTDKDRRRFAYQKAGELWMSDVMHGPAVRQSNNKKRKTYLIAFLDDATRVVPFARFTSSENTQAFLPVFEQAIMRRGIPQRLFVDSVPRNRIDVLCPGAICGRESTAAGPMSATQQKRPHNLGAVVHDRPDSRTSRERRPTCLSATSFVQAP
jgi:transposase InsO family protein